MPTSVAEAEEEDKQNGLKFSPFFIGKVESMATVVITGGSRGIGAAAVELFAARGDRVVFLYEKNHEAAKAVAQKTGATAICCDVADGEAVKAAFAKIPAVDILVCNAGICHTGLMSMLPEADWDRVFHVNVKGMYHCINAAMPSFLKKHKGSVVTVSSMWGQVGASCEAVYSATKGAVIALTKALAKELGPSGIQVNCVAPGVILTDMCAGIDPEILAEMAEEAPVGRNGTPMDVAKAILYLSEADFVTGQVLPVNGGFVI
jgi:3-oxoacyl-[acyl-carrier protein] reductase